MEGEKVRKPNFCSQTLADPVFLHRQHLIGPAGQPVTIKEQIFGKISDPEKDGIESPGNEEAAKEKIGNKGCKKEISCKT